MELALMRFVDLLLRPAATIMILVLGGALLVKRYPRTGRAFIVAGMSLFYLLSTGYVATRIIRPLEAGYRPLSVNKAKADVIVVLSGDAKYFPWHDVKTVPSADSLDRAVTGAVLYRSLRLPMIISGGRSDPTRSGLCEADAMAGVAVSLGVPRKDIRSECASTDTLGNAVEIRKLIGRKRIILVTSAYHMERAEGMFIKQGFSVVPAPAGFAGDDQSLSVYSLIPRARNLLIADAAIHEYVGHVWYALRGVL